MFLFVCCETFFFVLTIDGQRLHRWRSTIAKKVFCWRKEKRVRRKEGEKEKEKRLRRKEREKEKEKDRHKEEEKLVEETN